ncbi:MAG: 3-oxoacyl-[acyl-carrier-protein] synthase III C-terminal domain-containing protein [Chloroherpetonaceae bacterium]|nr:3-oxoacyl-[acyl-carrier-protein] synthase III C-terminal domain-containing protein [Chloroherpetonaceae bacterium]
MQRLPIWGVGCAGGAMALSWAMRLAKAEPEQKILAVVTELCGLTFIRNDLSKAAVISSALFADGAAAVLITGDKAKVPVQTHAPCLLAAATETMPNSLDIMGWHFSELGFNVKLSKDVPEVVRTFLRSVLVSFLNRRRLSLSDIKHFITHPGGAKVLEAYQAIGIPPCKLHYAWDVLRKCGNMSAATVLFILERFLEELKDEHAAFGVVTALGPGFSAELVLLHWD